MSRSIAQSRNVVVRRMWAALVPLGIASGLLCSSADAAVQAPGAFASLCQAFAPKELPNAAVVIRVSLDQPDPDRPLRCAVRGEIVSSPTSTIHWKVDLPDTAVWNSRLLFVGGGGFDGWLPTDQRNWAYLAQYLGPDRPRMWTFVVASSDSGHQGKGAAHGMVDFSWALGNPSALKNHADMANHLVLQVAVALTRRFYGREPTFRYMVGQSNGGRAGLMAAQRHPDDYDGILAFAPAISQEGFAANQIKLQQQLFSSPDSWLGPDQVRLFVHAQVQACDGLDGLQDGVIDNYAACHFDPATLICKSADESRAECLTAGQVESVRLVLSDKTANVQLADGMIGYPGYGPGGDEDDWNGSLMGPSFVARAGIDYLLTDNIVKFGITQDPNATLMTHDPEQWKDAYLKLSQLLDATNPNLDKFAARHGKLITWYGVADYCVAMERLAQYFGLLEARYAPDKTKEFFRFFVSPSLSHSLTGPAANTFNFLTVLQDWVENSKAPQNLIAIKLGADGKVKFTRPLCEVGSHPQYRGKGDPIEASSFTCLKNELKSAQR